MVYYSESLLELLITSAFTVKILGQSSLHVPYTATVRVAFGRCYNIPRGTPDERMAKK